MQLKTVNIVEIEDDTIEGLYAYEVSEEGRQAACARFAEQVKTRDSEASEAEIKAFLEEGYYETGDYQLYLVESADV